eukprot:jgi/Psemu1/19564/gm1.19564_g
MGDPLLPTTYTAYFQNPASNSFGIYAHERKLAYQGIFKKSAHRPAAASPSALLDFILDLFEAQMPLGQVIPNTGKVFGYLDDVVGDSGELAAVRADANMEYVAPEEGGHFDTLKGRKSFFILLDMPHIETHFLQEGCGPLLDTLQVAVTSVCLICPTGEAKLGPPFQHGPPLLAYMKVRQQRISEEREPLKDSPGNTTIEEAWGSMYAKRLLILCGKNIAGNLHPVYNALAKHKQNEKTHMIFQSQVVPVAEELVIFPPLTDPFHVADGILSLAFIPPGGSMETLKRQHKESATMAMYNTMISTEGNSHSLKDSLSLHKTKSCIPMDWTEATSQFECYLVLAQGLWRLKKQHMPLRRAIADDFPSHHCIAANAFCTDLGSIQQKMQASFTELYAKRKDTHWESLQKDFMMADCSVATSPANLHCIGHHLVSGTEDGLPAGGQRPQNQLYMRAGL